MEKNQLRLKKVALPTCVQQPHVLYSFHGTGNQIQRQDHSCRRRLLYKRPYGLKSTRQQVRIIG
jgi:hypothetical protein